MGLIMEKINKEDIDQLKEIYGETLELCPVARFLYLKVCSDQVVRDFTQTLSVKNSDYDQRTEIARLYLISRRASLSKIEALELTKAFEKIQEPYAESLLNTLKFISHNLKETEKACYFMLGKLEKLHDPEVHDKSFLVDPCDVVVTIFEQSEEEGLQLLNNKIEQIKKLAPDLSYTWHDGIFQEAVLLALGVYYMLDALDFEKVESFCLNNLFNDARKNIYYTHGAISHNKITYENIINGTNIWPPLDDINKLKQDFFYLFEAIQKDKKDKVFLKFKKHIKKTIKLDTKAKKIFLKPLIKSTEQTESILKDMFEALAGIFEMTNDSISPRMITQLCASLVTVNHIQKILHPRLVRLLKELHKDLIHAVLEYFAFVCGQDDTIKTLKCLKLDVENIKKEGFVLNATPTPINVGAANDDGKKIH